jgi:hypothetical protein
MGPYAPPLPTEVERTEGEPMAVASDKMTAHDSFKPTTQSKDAYDKDVAQRWKTVPDSAKAGMNAVQESFSVNPRDAAEGKTPEEEKPETVAMQDPPGYSEVDEHGYKHLKGEDEE